MQLEPYIFFDGHCEEAMAHYQKIFGGKADLMRMKDSPMAAQIPPEQQNNIMHASFVAGDVKLMASDGDPTKPSGKESNIALSIGMKGRNEADRIFGAPAESGAITPPLQEMFCGAYFGTVTDKFGIDWMLNCE